MCILLESSLAYLWLGNNCNTAGMLRIASVESGIVRIMARIKLVTTLLVLSILLGIDIQLIAVVLVIVKL